VRSPGRTAIIRTALIRTALNQNGPGEGWRGRRPAATRWPAHSRAARPTCWPPWRRAARPPSAARPADALEIICAVYESAVPAARIPGLMTVTRSGFADEISPDPGAQLVTLAAESIRHLELRSAWSVNVADFTAAQVAGFGPCSPTPACGSPRSVADREDPGRRAARPELDRESAAWPPSRTSSARRSCGCSPSSSRPGSRLAVPGRGHRPDGRAGGGGRRRGPDARPRNGRDLRGHPGPLRRPDRRGGLPRPAGRRSTRRTSSSAASGRSRKVTGCSARTWSTSRSRTPSGHRRGGARARATDRSARTLAALRPVELRSEPHLASAGPLRRVQRPRGLQTQAARALKSC